MGVDDCVVAVDGPSGSGKSTVSRQLALAMDARYLDTGAMYRAVALAVTKAGLGFEAKEKVADIAEKAKIDLIGEPDALKIFLDGDEVTSEIRTLQIAQAASVVSTNSEVRKVMVRHQREIGNAAPNGCVLEGRDIGSVVFPDADIKFFLTAKPEARARRRYEEDKTRGRVSTYEQTLAEINERD